MVVCKASLLADVCCHEGSPRHPRLPLSQGPDNTLLMRDFKRSETHNMELLSLSMVLPWFVCVCDSVLCVDPREKLVV